MNEVLRHQEGAEKFTGDKAKLSILMGATALSDVVKTTLGPKGMDKILLKANPGGETEIEVTNDGATILKTIHVDNPSAKILVDISKTQDDEVGDGTTSVCVLAGEILREAEKLLNERIHPQTIIEGYREATKIGSDVLKKYSYDNRKQQKKFYEDLLNIARTTISSKIANVEKEHFAKLCVEAVLRLKDKLDLESIQILKKKGGNMKDSFLDEGFILNKEIGIGGPCVMKNAKILIANTSMDADKVKILSGKIVTDSIKELANIEDAEREKMTKKCEKIKAHKCNIFINRQLIYDQPMEYFAENGIMAIEHADFDGIERLSLVLGGDIVSTFDTPKDVVLGECKKVEEIMIGEDKLIKFSGCKRSEACSIVLRGASSHLLDELERSLHDALCVLVTAMKDSRIVYGGGCSEMLMAKAIEEKAKLTSGKKALAMEAFAKALKQIPSIIADNAGLDAAELISALEAEHYKNNFFTGIDILKGTIGNMQKLGICEPFRVKHQVLLSASEAAEMLLKVDEIIRTAPRKRTQDPRYGM